MHEASKAKVAVICDYCGKSYKMEYTKYIKDVLNGYVKKCACKSCGFKKNKETIYIKYGVKSTTCLEEVRNKQKETCFKKYGCISPLQNEKVKKKIKETNLRKYGTEMPSKSTEIRQKIKETNLKRYGKTSWLATSESKKMREKIFLEKYGVKNPFEAKELQEKIKNTNIRKYGVKNPMQNIEINNRARKTLYENGKTPTSKQQKHLAKLFMGKLNYPVEKYSIDIYLEPNIAIEYDGGGHDLQVTLGSLSLKNFKNKEVGRYYCLKRNGYKCIRFINKKDKNFSDYCYLKLLEIALNMLEKEDVNWVEIDLNLRYIKTKKQQLNLEKISELFE